MPKELGAHGVVGVQVLADKDAHALVPARDEVLQVDGGIDSVAKESVEARALEHGLNILVGHDGLLVAEEPVGELTARDVDRPDRVVRPKLSIDDLERWQETLHGRGTVEQPFVLPDALVHGAEPFSRLWELWARSRFSRPARLRTRSVSCRSLRSDLVDLGFADGLFGWDEHLRLHQVFPHAPRNALLVEHVRDDCCRDRAACRVKQAVRDFLCLIP